MLNGDMLEWVDKSDLGSDAAMHESSNLSIPTNKFNINFIKYENIIFNIYNSRINILYITSVLFDLGY